jgi:hypothetical protein
LLYRSWERCFIHEKKKMSNTNPPSSLYFFCFPRCSEMTFLCSRFSYFCFIQDEQVDMEANNGSNETINIVLLLLSIANRAAHCTLCCTMYLPYIPMYQTVFLTIPLTDVDVLRSVLLCYTSLMFCSCRY